MGKLTKVRVKGSGRGCSIGGPQSREAVRLSTSHGRGCKLRSPTRSVHVCREDAASRVRKSRQTRWGFPGGLGGRRPPLPAQARSNPLCAFLPRPRPSPINKGVNAPAWSSGPRGLPGGGRKGSKHAAASPPGGYGRPPSDRKRAPAQEAARASGQHPGDQATPRRKGAHPSLCGASRRPRAGHTDTGEGQTPGRAAGHLWTRTPLAGAPP